MKNIVKKMLAKKEEDRYTLEELMEMDEFH